MGMFVEADDAVSWVWVSHMFPYTLHTFTAVSQSSAIVLKSEAVAQQCFNADVYIVAPTLT